MRNSCIRRTKLWGVKSVGKTEVKVSPLDDSILDIRLIYSFSKYKNWDEHLDDVLDHLKETPDMNYIKHEF